MTDYQKPPEVIVEQVRQDMALDDHRAGDAAKIKVGRAISNTEQRGAALLESARGLVVINGGGAVALGALLGQTWDKANAAAMRPWVLVGILVLVFGVTLASVLPYLRYRNSFHPDREILGKSPWWRWHHRCTVASVVAFVVGMVIAVIGGFRALG